MNVMLAEYYEGRIEQLHERFNRTREQWIPDAIIGYHKDLRVIYKVRDGEQEDGI